MRGLVERGAVGLVTTHDLALTELAGGTGSLANAHFEDQVRDGEIAFDYRLRPGVVGHSNALALMRAVGLDAADFGEVVLGTYPLAVLVSRSSPLAEDKAALGRLRVACESKEGQRVMAGLLARWE